MKVFCGDCSNFCRHVVGNEACYAGQNIKLVSNYEGEYIVHINTPRKINRNNDCKWYNPSFTTRIFNLFRWGVQMKIMIVVIALILSACSSNLPNEEIIKQAELCKSYGYGTIVYKCLWDGTVYKVECDVSKK